MGTDPAFLFYPGDYLKDTQCLNANMQVAYDRIMCEHMRNICITQQQLKFFTKNLNEDEKEELIFILKKIKGGYQISWVAENIIKRRNYNESRRKNRAGSSDKHMLTHVKHMENENINDKASKKKERKREDKKSLIYLNSNLDKFNIDEFKNIDIEKEHKKFCDWLKSKDKRYKDYSAGFRNWLRSDFVNKKQQLSGNNKKQLNIPKSFSGWKKTGKIKKDNLGHLINQYERWNLKKKEIIYYCPLCDKQFK